MVVGGALVQLLMHFERSQVHDSRVQRLLVLHVPGKVSIVPFVLVLKCPKALCKRANGEVGVTWPLWQGEVAIGSVPMSMRQYSGQSNGKLHFPVATLWCLFEPRYASLVLVHLVDDDAEVLCWILRGQLTVCIVYTTAAPLLDVVHLHLLAVHTQLDHVLCSTNLGLQRDALVTLGEVVVLRNGNMLEVGVPQLVEGGQANGVNAHELEDVVDFLTN
jgi:hypothetical protein